MGSDGHGSSRGLISNAASATHSRHCRRTALSSFSRLSSRKSELRPNVCRVDDGPTRYNTFKLRSYILKLLHGRVIGGTHSSVLRKTRAAMHTAAVYSVQQSRHGTPLRFWLFALASCICLPFSLSLCQFVVGMQIYLFIYMLYVPVAQCWALWC